MFESTKPGSYGEDRKAQKKNHNLPILQFMYMGDADTALTCLVTGTPAFVEWPCLVQGRPLRRFRLDFNHIRQQQSGNRVAGTSLDKSTYGPSDIFRTVELDDTRRVRDLVEFMTMIPVCTEYHSYISQSSSYGDITLENYPKDQWPWHLKSRRNFAKFTKQFRLEWIDYRDFIDHLSSIDHPPVRSRCGTDWNSKTLSADWCWQ